MLRRFFSHHRLYIKLYTACNEVMGETSNYKGSGVLFHTNRSTARHLYGTLALYELELPL